MLTTTLHPDLCFLWVSLVYLSRRRRWKLCLGSRERQRVRKCVQQHLTLCSPLRMQPGARTARGARRGMTGSPRTPGSRIPPRAVVFRALDVLPGWHWLHELTSAGTFPSSLQLGVRLRPQSLHVEALIFSITECACIWRKGLLRDD